MLKTEKNTKKTLQFSDLDAPILLDRADNLLPIIRSVLPNWDFRIVANDAANTPCLKVSGEGTDEYLCNAAYSEASPRRWNAVNAVCEMVVELAWEQIRSNPSWLCLHCAAIEFAGRLVLFPNRRRAGKSTLTAVLAKRGYKVFTDDFLPVLVGQSGEIRGRANGVLPRVRLPIPDEFQADFRNWADRNAGPRNSQYKFLDIENLARRGEELPIGAVVVLDRDQHTETRISDISQSAVLDSLISQNFARALHSGKILSASSAVAETAERYELNYASAEEAADQLEQKFQSWDTPTPIQLSPIVLHEQGADLSRLEQQAPEFDPDVAYVRAARVTEIVVEGTAYLSDSHGLCVHRLNSSSAAIWKLLEEPSTASDVSEILCAAFPDAQRDQVEHDSVTTLGQFVANHLIVPTNDEQRTEQ